MTRAQRLVTLEQLEMPTEVARAPLLFADTEHVRDERAGTAPSGDGKSEPAIGVESQLFAVGDEDRATCVGKNGQDVDRDELLRRHTPDSRLEANHKSQRVERLPDAVDQVIGGALGVLPTERRKNHVAETGNALSPAIPVPTQPKPLRMERGHGKLDLRPLAGGSRRLQSYRVVRHRARILAAARTRQDAR